MKGYMGKVLLVNLSTKEIQDQEIPDKVYENLLSGVGLGAYMLYKHVPAGADPLGPDNMLGFTSGLLTGTASLMTGRWMVVGKSPLTGGWGDANCGGTFAPGIKKCGYDGIFFTGTSEKPVYLYIDDKGAEIRDATHVWGKDAVEAENILATECKNKKTPRIALIGQGGENLSLISGVTNDSGRIAARSGLGAVMGSKKLKAVVLSGNKTTKYKGQEKIKELSKEFAEKVRKANLSGFMNNRVFNFLYKIIGNPKKIGPEDQMSLLAGAYKKYGTCIGTTPLVIIGDSPVKNWSGSVVDFPAKQYKKLNVDKIIKRENKKYHCHACVIGCGGICDIKDVGNQEFSHTHKPEYETLSMFGSHLLNSDQKSILYINELLNRAGMDTISTGHAVAFAIECYENGILTKDDTDGLELKWGDSEIIVKLVKKMIKRDGIGDVLADGTKKAAEIIGKGSEKYAIHAGGQEPGAHDPRYSPNLALGFSCDPSPGKHTQMASDYNGMFLWEKVSWAPKVVSHPKMEDYIPSEEGSLKAVATSCYKMLTDGVGACLLAANLGINHYKIFEMLNAATDWDKSPDEYMEIGKRIMTLRQMFNIKQGLKPIDFMMHKRLATPLTGGFTKGRGIETEAMMRYFWKGFDWDENTGEPTPQQINKLGLDELVA